MEEGVQQGFMNIPRPTEDRFNEPKRDSRLPRHDNCCMTKSKYLSNNGKLQGSAKPFLPKDKNHTLFETEKALKNPPSQTFEQIERVHIVS
jgi:hypothetical protein